MGCLWILLLILSLSLFPLSTGEDSLTVGTSIRANQTIISAGGNFALGFFSPESSAYSYLGIWYNKIPKQSVIWVGNRDSPLPKNSLTTLTLSDNGNFVLTNQWKRVIWSTNVSAAGKNVNSIEGVLLDTGNLVIRTSDQSSILWQSFEHPTDTWMPTMKLVLNKKTGKQAQFISWANDEDPRPGIFSLGQDPTACPQFYIWKRDDIYWRSNIYDASISLSTGYNKSIGFALYLTYIVEGDDTSISYSFSEDLGNLRITLVPSGQIVLLSWQQSSNTWTHVWRWPAEKCDSYGSCGPFSSCVQNGSLPVCQCLMGFEPTVQKDWINGNWASGCDRTKALACDGTDRFLKFERMKLPDHSFSIQNMSISECEFQCLRNCSCTAYAYANISEEHKVSCLNWFGPLIDLHNLATGRDLYVRLHGSELDSNVENGKLLQRTRILIAVAATAIFVGLIFVVVVCVLRMKRLRKQERTDGSMSEPHSMPNPSVRGQNDTELLSFSLRAVLAATDDFSVQNKLGRGGFGSVYKGHLPGNQEVAVKRLSKKSSQGVEEFMNELKLIAKLQHTNLVRLLGCCVEGDEKILIYEYMPNRSLDTFLFEPSEQATLDWSKRFQIIEGIAQGFLYLHKYSRLKVIHRDLKASNILLDHDMTPKVSDFGMARIFGINQSEAKTNRVVGTYGYMSPEYAMYGQFSEKSDVFSFGVLLLEIVSGKRSTNFHRTEFSLTLLGWAWENWKDGRGSEFTDPSIRETSQPQEVEKCINIGLLCVQEIPTDRPTMSDVILILGNENALLPSPKEPAFSTRKSFLVAIASSSQTSGSFSNNEVTLSTLHPR